MTRRIGHAPPERRENNEKQNPMSSLQAKLEGSKLGLGRPSRDEGTVNTAFTSSSGSSSGSRTRRKVRSTSLSEEIVAGSHFNQDDEHSKPRPSRRGRRKTVADSLDLAVTQEQEDHHASTAHHQHRRVFKRDGMPHSGRNLSTQDQHEMSMSHSIAIDVEASPIRSRPGRPSGRSMSPKHNRVSISPTNRRTGRSPGRATVGQRFAKEPTKESSPTRNQQVRRSARRSSSPKTNRQSGNVRSVSPVHSKRISGGPTRRTLTPDQSVRKSQRSLSPRNSAGGESNAPPRKNVSPKRASGESRPVRRKSREQSPGVHHSPERSLRGKRRVTMHDSVNSTGMMKMHDSISTTGMMTVSSLGRKQRSKSPHRRSGGPASVGSAQKPSKSRSLSPATTKRKSRPSPLEALLGKEGREQQEKVKASMNARPRRPIATDEKPPRAKSDVMGHRTRPAVVMDEKPQRNKSDIMGHPARPKKSEKPRVRQHSYDNSRDHHNRVRNPSPTRQILDSEVRILSLKEESKLISTSMQSMFSDDDWGETEFSEPFAVPAPPRAIQRIPSKSHRMKLEEDRGARPRRVARPGRRRSAPHFLEDASSHDTSANRKVALNHHPHHGMTEEETVLKPSRQRSRSTEGNPMSPTGPVARRVPKSRRKPTSDPNMAVDDDGDDSSSPFAVMPADTGRLVGPLEKWGKDAKNKSQH